MGECSGPGTEWREEGVSVGAEQNGSDVNVNDALAEVQEVGTMAVDAEVLVGDGADKADSISAI